LSTRLSVKPGTLWQQSRILKRLSTEINTFCQCQWTGDKVDRTGDTVASSVDFFAGSFDFLHIHEHLRIWWCHVGRMAEDQDKQFQSQSQKNKHLSYLNRNQKWRGKNYAVGIRVSRPKHRSGPSLIFMKFWFCCPSVFTGDRSVLHSLWIFVAWSRKSLWHSTLSK